MTEATTPDLSAHDDEYQNVTITDEGERPTQYRVYCFKDNINNPEAVLTAGALNLNGYAFATSGFEIGEYKHTVRVTREEGSRYVNLVIDANDD